MRMFKRLSDNYRQTFSKLNDSLPLFTV